LRIEEIKESVCACVVIEKRTRECEEEEEFILIVQWMLQSK